MDSKQQRNIGWTSIMSRNIKKLVILAVLFALMYWAFTSLQTHEGVSTMSATHPSGISLDLKHNGANNVLESQQMLDTKQFNVPVNADEHKESNDAKINIQATVEEYKKLAALQPGHDRPLRKKTDRLHLAVVACGERLEQATVMLKSSVLFTKQAMHIHVFTDEHGLAFIKLFESWPKEIRNKFVYTIHKITFPEGTSEQWKQLFRPCACQRLFIPNLLKDVELLLYMDTDTVVLKPLDNLWKYFYKFNTTQLAALSLEDEIEEISWYKENAKFPYYGKLAVNTGVMLMNLSRMREWDWQSYVVSIHDQWKDKIMWGDQDLLNILFHFYPERLYTFPCEWNFKRDHCKYGSNCKRAEEYGAAIIHGNGHTFINDDQPSFKTIYLVMKDYEFGTDVIANILEPIQQQLQHLFSSHQSKCAKDPHLFHQGLNRELNRMILERDI